MKKNAALREFKKLKSQINQIEEIAHHSKVGALIEQETSIRKKIRLLKEMENGYNRVEKTFQWIIECFSSHATIRTVRYTAV